MTLPRTHRNLVPHAVIALGLLVFPGAVMADVPSGIIRLAAVDDSLADTETLDSSLVRRIQERLGELGLYRGRLDGRFGPEIGKAIRDYERQSGLPIDGRPTRELLEHLESATGQARRLLRRLDVVRQEQIEAARRAFEANPAALNMVEQAVAESIMVTTAVDSEVCFKMPTARCLLAEALEATKRIGKIDFRDWALGDIAAAQATSGDVTGALATTSRMADARLLMTALGKVARAQAKAGNLDEARVTATALPDARLQAEALLELAKAEIGSGQLVASRKTLEQALMAAGRVTDERWRIGLLANIAVIQMSAGDHIGAGNSFERGLNLAQQLRSTEEQSRPLGEIASAQARAGRLGQALETADKIEEAEHRTPVLILAAQALAEAGHVDEAFETALSIEDARYRVAALGRSLLPRSRLVSQTPRA